MKIVQMITHLDRIGGAQIHVIELTKQLLADGHEVFVMYGGGNCIYSFDHERVHWIQLKEMVHPIHAVQDVKAIREAKRWFEAIQPDLVATHSSKSGVVGRIAANLAKVPNVFTAHGWAFNDGVQGFMPKIYVRIEKQLAKYTNEIISVSTYDHDLAMRHKFRSKGRLRVVHNGIMPIEIEKCKQKEVTIVMVSRFEKPKRFDLLVEAFERLNLPNTKLILVGDGTKMTEVMEQTNKYRTKERIEFVGPQRDVYPYLAKADIFAQITDYEGLPIAIIEALSMELPVVASNVGGVPDLVIDGKNGYLVNNSIEDIVQKLEMLVQEEWMRREMGQQSKALFNEKYHFNRMYERTLEVYQQAVNQQVGISV